MKLAAISYINKHKLLANYPIINNNICTARRAAIQYCQRALRAISAKEVLSISPHARNQRRPILVGYYGYLIDIAVGLGNYTMKPRIHRQAHLNRPKPEVDITTIDLRLGGSLDESTDFCIEFRKTWCCIRHRPIRRHQSTRDRCRRHAHCQHRRRSEPTNGPDHTAVHAEFLCNAGRSSSRLRWCTRRATRIQRCTPDIHVVVLHLLLKWVRTVLACSLLTDGTTLWFRSDIADEQLPLLLYAVLLFLRAPLYAAPTPA